MQKYNDYVFLTKRYLKNYAYFKASIQLMRDNIKSLEQEMRLDVAAPISKYGDEPGGGFRELNTIEAAADRHIHIIDMVQTMQSDIRAMQRIIDKLDSAMHALKHDDMVLVWDHYCAGMGWEEVGDKHHYSGKWAGERGRKAVEDMALMMFGIKAQPTRLNFVFAS